MRPVRGEWSFTICKSIPGHHENLCKELIVQAPDEVKIPSWTNERAARIGPMQPRRSDDLDVPEPATSAFLSVRPRLFGIAYRMLGTAADAGVENSITPLREIGFTTLLDAEDRERMNHESRSHRR
jgi:hypothetical protein